MITFMDNSDKNQLEQSIDEWKEDLNDVSDALSYEVTEDIYNTLTFTSGMMGLNGAIYSATTLKYSNKIHVKVGDVLSFSSTTSSTFRFVTAFHGESAIHESGAENIASYTVPEGINGVVVTVYSTATNYKIIADGSATDAGLKETANEAKDGLVGALPTFTTASYTGATYNESAKTLTCSLTVTFTWGQLFGGNNPRTYYADKKVEQYGEEAQRRLTALNTALSGCNYVLTIASK